MRRPRVVRRATASRQILELFPSNVTDSCEMSPDGCWAFRTDECPSVAGTIPCTDTVCAVGEPYAYGLPSIVKSQCLDVGGKHTEVPKVHGVAPAAYATIASSISVLMQVLAFASIGALADHGHHRMRCLKLSMWISIGATVALVLVPSVWWLGGPLFIVANVAYGASCVMYNGALPLMSRADQEYMDNPSPKLLERTSSSISSVGYGLGFVGSLVGTILAIALQLALLSANACGTAMSFAWTCVLAAGWWASFGTYSVSRMAMRPGPPLPHHVTSYVWYSWSKVAITLRRIKEVPGTAKFLGLWFIYSDGYSAILTPAVIMAQSELDFGCFDPGIAVGLMLLLALLAAAVSCKIVDTQAAKHQWSDRSIIVATLGTFMATAVYCSIGFFTDDFGFRKGWEVFILAIVIGAAMGPVQSSSRSLFGTLIPPGMETEFYSFYAITDKGSSWIGPLVFAGLSQAYGTGRGIFIFAGIMCLIGILGLQRLDIARARARARDFRVSEPPAAAAERHHELETVTNAAGK